MKGEQIEAQIKIDSRSQTEAKNSNLEKLRVTNSARCPRILTLCMTTVHNTDKFAQIFTYTQ